MIDKAAQAQTKMKNTSKESHQHMEPFNSHIIELHKNHNEFLIKRMLP